MIDYFQEEDYNKRLKILGKCGLTEVWKYITQIGDLSDGEKFRFMLYCLVMRALHDKRDAILIIDEFCSTLDRVTAKVVAQNIHKLRDLLNKEGIKVTFILASAHEDLIPYLKADYNYFKEFQPVLTKVG
jgi:ABC-type ATPase with predicted acetyltransferase domain